MTALVAASLGLACPVRPPGSLNFRTMHASGITAPSPSLASWLATVCCPQRFAARCTLNREAGQRLGTCWYFLITSCQLPVDAPLHCDVCEVASAARRCNGPCQRGSLVLASPSSVRGGTKQGAKYCFWADHGCFHRLVQCLSSPQRKPCWLPVAVPLPIYLQPQSSHSRPIWRLRKLACAL